MKPTYEELKKMSPIKGFHVMEFIRKTREKEWRKTRRMTPEQRKAYDESKRQAANKLFGR